MADRLPPSGLAWALVALLLLVVAGLVIRIIRDVRAATALAARVTAATEALAQENRRLSQSVRLISGNIAHELARPIVDILRYIDDNEPQCETCGANFDTVYEKVSNIHELYIRILDLTRISEMSKFDLERVDLSEVLVESARLCAEDSLEKRLIVDLSAEPASVFGEFWLLTSAVSNVIANGVRFSPDGGQLRLASGYERGLPFVLVEDAGPGLPDSDLGTLLSRLKQGSIAEEDMDHGFGLRLVQATAAMHGANIALGRSRDGGLAFRITFPNAAANVAET